MPPSPTRGRPDRLLRSGLWSSLGSPGLESFALWQGRGFGLEGTVVTAHQSKPLTAWYRVRCDGHWRTREVRARVQWGGRSGEVRLQSDGRGRWLRDGREVRAIRGCTDIDLQVSPSTNTLPIRRLGLAIGQSSEVAAAWLRFPGLTLEPLPQRYTRLDSQRYRYESRGGSFTAELTVDELGLVVTYAGIWQRVC